MSTDTIDIYHVQTLYIHRYIHTYIYILYIYIRKEIRRAKSSSRKLMQTPKMKIVESLTALQLIGALYH